MHTLLLLLTTAHAAADPVWVDHPPPRTPLCYRVSSWLQHCGMVISGVAHTYDRPGIPVSTLPTPAYLRYFGEPPHPVLTAPVPSTTFEGADNEKAKEETDREKEKEKAK
jgi:hypothetical protein